MNFWQKLGKVLAQNVAYTVVFVVAVIIFVYFAGGDIIGGMLTALSALVAYISGALLYEEYKKMPKIGTGKKSGIKKSSKRK